MISDELTPNNIQNLADELGLEMKIKNGSSWITCWSPLREEGQPSFGFNVKSGAWKDHGTGETGDIVTLVELLKSMDNKEATKWIAERTNIAGSIYNPPKNGHSKQKKEPVDFWTDENLKFIKSGKSQLNKNPEHPLLKKVLEYDCLNLETLQKYRCGIVKKWGNEWLAFPYATGCQLYRREDGEKVIRSVPNSTPGSSFFGESRIAGNEVLFIAKSPREAMLLHQTYGFQADVIGLCTGEQGNVSSELRSSLTQLILHPNITKIFTFLDCDTENALKTAKDFTKEIAGIAEKEDFSGNIHLVNISEQTGSAYKDITDCFRADMDMDSFNALLNSTEAVFTVHSPTVNEREHLNDHWFKPSDPLKEPVPDLEFIVDGYCAKGLITVIGGSAGSGKSLLNQILFQKRNDELMPTGEGKAIYLTGADSSAYEIRRRAKAIQVNNGLHTVCIPEDHYCVATNEVFMQELSHQIIEYGADVVIFDTLADFHDGNLYEAELANRTMKAFTALARNADVAVILITHTRKGSKIKQTYNVEDISDSRVFGTKADFVFGLKSEYQQDGSNLIELQCVKSRSAQPMQPLRAEIYFNTINNELKIRRCDKLFAVELESQSKEQEREHKIKEVHRLKDEGKSVRNIAEQLDIGVGTVSKYSKKEVPNEAPF